jgi:hypothetical protein
MAGMVICERVALVFQGSLVYYVRMSSYSVVFSRLVTMV